MSDAPDTIWITPLPGFHGEWFPQSEDGDVAYVRHDIAEAALSAARAEGRREGLLEAEARVAKLWGSARYGTIEAEALYDAREAIRAAAEVSP